MLTFETRINDIPCQCKVYRYKPATDTSSRAEFTYLILDMQDNIDFYLDKIAFMSPEVEQHLQEEYEAAMLAEKHCIPY